jgi:hypothetical protein
MFLFISRDLHGGSALLQMTPSYYKCSLILARTNLEESLNVIRKYKCKVSGTSAQHFPDSNMSPSVLPNPEASLKVISEYKGEVSGTSAQLLCVSVKEQVQLLGFIFPFYIIKILFEIR